jgi:hypothetical protein
VALLEVAIDNDAVGVDDERAGVRQIAVTFLHGAAVGGALGLDRRVEDAELLDDPAPDIPEQRVGDVVGIRELAEDIDGVVAQRVDGDFGSPVNGSLQLDQLRPAPRSPRGAAVNDEESLAARPIFVEVDNPTVLVGKSNIGKSRADLRSERIEINGRNRGFGC